MKVKYMICIVCFLLLFQSGCQSIINTATEISPFATETPKATLTLKPTITMAATITPVTTSTLWPTRDPMNSLEPLLPEIPEGFRWEMMDDMNVVMLMPDGWFASRDQCPLISFIGELYIPPDEIMQGCIYMEDITETFKYSTGETVLKYSDLDDPEGFALYLLGYLSQSDGSEMLIYDAESEDDKRRMQLDMLNIHATTEIVKTWDNQWGDNVIHHLRVEAHYQFEDEGNKTKIVNYSALAFQDDVYLVVFETPKDQWDEMLEQYGLIMDYVVVFQM
jgi:hypothetical protein